MHKARAYVTLFLGAFLGVFRDRCGQQPGELQLNFPGAPVLYVWL